MTFILYAVSATIKRVVFGEGTKSSSHEENVATDDDENVNFWHSSENHSKLCTEGAVANMLFHMKMKDGAIEFHRLSCLPPKELLQEMNVTNIPKKVWKNDHVMDPIEKCVWMLERKYNCHRLGYLNAVQCNTAEKLVANL